MLTDRMPATVEALEWDTEFFGIPIGRVDLSGASAGDLPTIEAQARDLGIACLYASHPPGPPELPAQAQDAGYRLVEAAITLERRDPEPLEHPRDVMVRAGTVEDLPLLAPAIDGLAPWSRFAADPRFGLGAARAMHEAWVRRAATATDDQWMLAVAEDAAGVVGFSTHTRTPSPRVDLMSVLSPGSGASWALMARGIEWAGSDAFRAGPIAARNLRSVRFVELCGFRVCDVRYVYHRWFTDDRVRA